MSMSDQEYIEKREKIFSLLLEVSDSLVAKFFDPDSDKMLDEKIEVLTALKEGRKPSEIPKYYDILELYPEEGAQWD